jgi:hypothetical protein
VTVVDELAPTNPANAPAGWYSGGVPGEERWWDGSAWTSHTRPAAASHTPVGARQPNKTGLLIMGIVSACLLLPTGLYFLWALVSGPVYALGASIPVLLLLGSTVFCFVMVARLSRRAP